MKQFFASLRWNNQSPGIALLLVLAALTLLSAMAVEFEYNSTVTYNLAYNEKERTQAFFLAQSGLNFTRLVLSFDKEAKKLANQASKKLGKSIQIQPLYQMIPIDSAKIRLIADSGSGDKPAEGEGGDEAKPEGAEGDAKKEVPDSNQAVNFFDVNGAKEFLSFEGDFSSEVEEEDTKINLNAFYNLVPTQKEYDRLKATLYHLMVSNEFKGLFEDRFRGPKELAQNIADYIDRDDGVNDTGGEERGREGVAGGQNLKMKNAKLFSLDELSQVPGMTEGIFKKLTPYVTVWGKDEKIFLCRAPEPVVRAVILAYTENNTKMEALQDDNEDLMKKALDAVLNSCPDQQAMANELDKALGVDQNPAGGSESQPAPAGEAKAPTSTAKTPAKTPSFDLSVMSKDQADVFKVTGTGTVGHTEVRIKTVIDTSGGASKSWKELYWRVE